jgi:hypothetical protein
VSYNPLCHIPAALGLEVVDVPPKLSLPYADEAYRLYQSGVSLEDVASRFGTYATNLSRAFKRRGWEVRSISEGNRLRMGRMTPEERSANAGAAHDAVRGMTRTSADLEARAYSRMERRLGVSPLDTQMAEWLRDGGVWKGRLIVPGLAQAIGPYNVDVALYPVAVELWGGAWHRGGRAAARHQERTRYILDAGWNVVIVECTADCYALTRAAAEYVLSFTQSVRRHPPAQRQYRVIRGTGQEVVRGCAECEDFPFKLPNRRADHVWCPHQLVTG